MTFPYVLCYCFSSFFFFFFFVNNIETKVLYNLRIVSSMLFVHIGNEMLLNSSSKIRFVAINGMAIANLSDYMLIAWNSRVLTWRCIYDCRMVKMAMLFISCIFDSPFFRLLLLAQRLFCLFVRLPFEWRTLYHSICWIGWYQIRSRDLIWSNGEESANERQCHEQLSN